VRAVAFDKGIAVVDLHRLSIDRSTASARGQFRLDRSRPTTRSTARTCRNGHLLFGGLVADEVRRLVPALAAYVLDPPIR